MKQLLIIISLCFLLCQSQLLGQSTYDIDVAPLLKDCEGTGQEKVDCGIETLYNYMTVDIQNDACAEVDTSKHYLATINVKANGKASIQKPFRFFKDKSHPCIDYFNEKLELFLDEHKYVPAMKDGSKKEFNTKIAFVYPPVNSQGIDQEAVHIVVDQMPRFRACESMIGSGLDKEPCAQSKMLQYIYMTLLYPADARANNIEGMVVTQFNVNTDGYLEDIAIVRSVGGGLDNASLAVIQSMNDLPQPPFVPGQQLGVPVKVKYTLPIRFKLESNNSSLYQKRKSKRANTN